MASPVKEKAQKGIAELDYKIARFKDIKEKESRRMQWEHTYAIRDKDASEEKKNRLGKAVHDYEAFMDKHIKSMEAKKSILKKFL